MIKKKQLSRQQEIDLMKRRGFVAAFFIIVLALLLISRLVDLQVFQHQRYTTLSKENQLALLPIQPTRGLIYDRNGTLLAKNVPVFSLEVIPDKIKNLQASLKKIETILPIDKTELTAFYKQLKQHRRFEAVPLKLQLTKHQVALFSVNEYKFPGFVIHARLMREYPFGADFVDVLGYVGRINQRELSKVNKTNYSATNYIGKNGIELSYESQLHGTVGYQQVETDASGRIVRVIKRTPPIPGDNIYLTIDKKLQEAAIKALGDHRGAVVVIQPSTGDVLALVSTPGYNPNLFVDGISHKAYKKLRNDPARPLFDRAIRGQYPMASTIKSFIAIAGLETGKITPGFKIRDYGKFRLPRVRHVYHDWKPEGHGIVDVHKAIVVSCDTFFYKLAYKLGIGPIDKILHKFGFGSKTGIDIPGELSGVVAGPKWKRKALGEAWYTGDTINSGIGQGYMLATPIQLADAVAAIAERGKRFEPHLVEKIITPKGAVIKEQPIPLPTIQVNPRVWNTVINGMRDVITSPRGTAYRGFKGEKAYTVAGKTGTAQVHSGRNREIYGDTENVPMHLRPHSLFIAFAPIKDPQVAIAAVVENAPGEAVHVTRKVLDYYFITEKHDKTLEK